MPDRANNIIVLSGLSIVRRRRGYWGPGSESRVSCAGILRSFPEDFQVGADSLEFSQKILMGIHQAVFHLNKPSKVVNFRHLNARIETQAVRRSRLITEKPLTFSAIGPCDNAEFSGCLIFVDVGIKCKWLIPD